MSRRLLEGLLIVVLLPLILPLAVAVVGLYLLHRMTLYILVWVLWLPKGKDVMIVYSDSPIWRDYMTTQILPLVQKRAVVLNWSERKKWPRWSFDVHVFRSFGRNYAFNPLVVLFRPLRPARIFRFWSAFKGWKRGYTEPVERLRSDLLRAL